jgi:hypothetical protein
MLYKKCPKCGGDLIVERGFAGDPPDIVCLQCGRRLSAAERAAALRRVADHRSNLTLRKATDRRVTAA